MNKIYLLDVDSDMCDAWHSEFKDDNIIEIVNQDFMTFMMQHPEIDGVVSPANSFGIMDGGYDAAITHYFGPELMLKVQQEIRNQFGGVIQPVGSCIPVHIHGNGYLLHTPTMLYPSHIIDARVIFQCMYSTMCVANKIDLKYILVPAFGRVTGSVENDVVARMMQIGYEQATHIPESISWPNVIRLSAQLNS